MNKTDLRLLISILLLITLTLATGCQTVKTTDSQTAQRVAPVPEEWHFIVTGDSRGKDTGVNAKILSEVAAEIVRSNPDFVLFPGDLVTGSKDNDKHRAQLTKWRETMQPVYDAKIKVYPVRGNHDRGSKKTGLAIWDDIFSGPYEMPDNGPTGEKNLTYSVMHKNAIIIALDNYSSNGQKINQTWVDTQFVNNNSPHVFVMGHEPAFSVKHKDCLDDNPQQRNNFLDSIMQEGGRVYFCGHDHFYDHISADHDNEPGNDIHQFIVGTAGAPLYSHDGKYAGDNAPYTITPIAGAKKHGYLIVSVNDAQVITTWVERVDENDFRPRDTWSYTTTFNTLNR